MKKHLLTFTLILIFFQTSFAQIFEIKKGDKWGFINIKGDIVVPPQYEYIYSDYGYSQQNEGYFVFSQDGKMGVYLSGYGELVSAIYEKIKVFSNAEKAGYIEVSNNGKVGVLDTLGELILKPTFDEIIQIVPGIFKYRKGNYWGTLDKHDIFQLPLAYDSIYSQLNQYIITRKNGFYWGWDRQGNIKFENFPEPCRFLSPYVLTYSAPDTNLVGIADSLGQVIYPPVFDSLSMIRPPFIKIHHKDQDGLIDVNGKMILDTLYSEIVIDSTARIWVRETGGLWGIISTEGDTISPHIIERLGSFEGNIAKVQHRSGWGVINQFGDILTEEGYAQVEIIGQTIRYLTTNGWKSFSVDENGRRLLKKKIMVRAKPKLVETIPEVDFWKVDPRDYGWFRRGRIFGWMHPKTGKIVIEPSFSHIYVIPHLGISMVMKHNSRLEKRLVGLVDHKTGGILMEPELNMIYLQDFRTQKVARAQYSTGAFVLINARGKVQLLKKTGYIDFFQKDVARAQTEGGYAKLVAKVGVEPTPPRGKAKWGYLTIRGQWGVKPIYQDVKPFHHGVGVVQETRKWGAYDSLFNMIIPPQFDSVFIALDKKDTLVKGTRPLICTQDKKKKYFFLDGDGNLRFSMLLEEAGDFFEGMAKVKIDGKWGYVDTLGNMIVKPIYERAGDFREGVCRIRHNLRWGFIDHSGDYTIEPKYMGAGDFVNGIAKVKEGARFGYVRKDDSWVIRPNYYRATDFYHGSAITRRKNNYGVINERGGTIIPHQFDRIYRDGTYFKVVKKGRIGFYSVEGKEIKPPSYNFVGKFVEGRAKVREGKYWGYIDTNRVELMKPMYTLCRDFTFSKAAVKLDHRWGVIDYEGNMVLGNRFRFIEVLKGNEAKTERGSGRFWRTPFDSIPSKKVWIDPNAGPVYSDIFETVKGKFGYDNIHPPKENIIVASSNQLYGLASSSGKILFDPRFEKINYRDGLYKVINDGNISYLSAKGEWVYPKSNADPTAREDDGR